MSLSSTPAEIKNPLGSVPASGVYGLEPLMRASRALWDMEVQLCACDCSRCSPVNTHVVYSQIKTGFYPAGVCVTFKCVNRNLSESRRNLQLWIRVNPEPVQASQFFYR